MNAAFLQQYWALIAASVLIFAIVLFVLFRLLHDSRRGRLSRALQHLSKRERAQKTAGKAVHKVRERLQKLQDKGDSVPPAQLAAAQDAVLEAEETLRLLDEQVLVVRNNARTVIVEDYPPKQHAAMRRKYLGETT